MKEKQYKYAECMYYCGFHNLPDGIEHYFDLYDDTQKKEIIERSFLMEVLKEFEVPAAKTEQMENALDEVESDNILCYFTKFLIWDMCQAKKRYEDNFYNSLVPTCMKSYQEYYPFLVLLACIKPSMQMLEQRGIPLKYYEDIPYAPLRRQLEKWILTDDITVSDFQWDINFYTCSIFLLDRFYFIPCKLEDEICAYRNRHNGSVVALQRGSIEFRRDGQVNGTNEIYDEEGKTRSKWVEDSFMVQANRVNPMGFLEKNTVTLPKADWELALRKGDILLAFHIPEGEGYTPQRVRNSMKLALEFYSSYFSEIPVKGFWSESWLYDSRLSLIMDYEKSNIVKVQRQFYLYPTKNNDDMLLDRVFGDGKIDLSYVNYTSSLQKAVINYMKTGARFNSLSMFVLKEDVDKIGECPYISENDIETFKAVMASYVKKK
ncbi:acyltransferase domain-containing protein [Anaerocolumna xylanovorans]|uniref:GNAT-like C-terminal domain-containing protein n=1 Tax=Anaerocolumna xylanovorans DSM 12503 TaxID=1121345 RepID=A0A1M7YJ83_9FIRM|nr:acyltransferase domain-containing protein [Anaerocolumna xylanovorans]SHO52680.1 hypothetical protein SAMN02745217_03777 [Anaerocolumna xylanovorans DSM 12503]